MQDLMTPAVSHRFLVNFLFHHLPSPMDIAFQRVTGLSRERQVSQQRQGGENDRNCWLPGALQHGSLVLERGVMLATPLTLQFERAMRGESMLMADVVIVLLNAQQLPVTSWTLSNALPVRWQTSDLDANSNGVLINTLELRYQDMAVNGVCL